MVRKLCVFLTGITCFVVPALTFAGWTRTYGTEAWEYGSSILETPDGGYIVGGYREIVSGGQGDWWLVKTTPAGDTSWTRTYGGEEDDYGTHVEMTSDGGYILAGECESWGYGGWLVKTDAVGDTQWTYTHGMYWSGFYCVRQTADGGYIATGYEEGAVSEDVLLLKLDSDGLVEWIKTYPGDNLDWGICVEQTSDGGYITSGSTYSFGAGEVDLWIIKTDEYGDTVWTRTYGGADYDWGGRIIQTSDGGYAALCEASSFGNPDYYDAWLLKLNQDGDTSWTKLYITDEGSVFYNLSQTQDGGYILAGGIGTVEAANAWIMKTDEEGDSVWTRSFGYDSEWDELGGIDLTSDGGYVFTGETSSFGAGDGDLWIIKTDSSGDTTGTFVIEDPAVEPLVKWQVENPVGSEIILQYTDCPHGFRAEVFDASGRKIDVIESELSSSTIRWGQRQTPGVYFICRVSGEIRQTRKVTLVR